MGFSVASGRGMSGEDLGGGRKRREKKKKKKRVGGKTKEGKKIKEILL